MLSNSTPIGDTVRPGRKDFVKVSGVRVNVPSKRRRRARPGSYRSKVLAFQDLLERVHGGPMTVVAGIVALLLLAYLVVALLKPERF
jgi:K+-transporting ATPase KdpF subunit